MDQLGGMCDSPAARLSVIRFTETGCSAEALFGRICGLGVRRTRWSVERAAVTGVSLRCGFKQALAVADALAAGDLQAGQEMYRRRRRLSDLMSRLILALSSRARVRQRLLNALSGSPRVMNFGLAVPGVSPTTAIPLFSTATFFARFLIGRSFERPSSRPAAYRPESTSAAQTTITPISSIISTPTSKRCG